MSGFEAFVVVWLAGIVGAAVVAEIVGRWRARHWRRHPYGRMSDDWRWPR